MGCIQARLAAVVNAQRRRRGRNAAPFLEVVADIVITVVTEGASFAWEKGLEFLAARAERLAGEALTKQLEKEGVTAAASQLERNLPKTIVSKVEQDVAPPLLRQAEKDTTQTVVKQGGTDTLQTVVKQGEKDTLRTVAKQGETDTLQTVVKQGEKDALTATNKAGAPLINCFPADTLVPTETGLQPIAQIKARQKVWSYDCRTGTTRLCEVELVHEADYNGRIVTVQVGGGAVRATAFHPFWVMSGEKLDDRLPIQSFDVEKEDRGGELAGRWVYSHDLQEGDTLYLRASGPAKVIGVQTNDDRTKVYNLTIRGLHTFFVGGMQVLVHNISDSLMEAVQRFYLFGEDALTEDELAAVDALINPEGAPKGAVPANLKAGQARNIEGIQNVTSKLESEEGGLARHLEDVRRERAGEVVSRKSGGKPHSHIDEITQARDALQTRVDRLKNSLMSPSHDAEVRVYIEEQIRQTEAVIDQMNKALGK